MKTYLTKKKTRNLFLLFSFLLAGVTACQKNEEASIIPPNDLIPISISSHSRIQARVVGSEFEANDGIGLFVLDQPNSLKDERYVDNKLFIYDGYEWNSDSLIYYPSSTDTCDFVAYFPFKENMLGEGTSKAILNVSEDQSLPANYILSDFLMDEKNNVIPSFDPVGFQFKHKLVKIAIEISPGEAYNSADDLLVTNPTVKLKGVATQTEYDLLSKEFSDPTDLKDVTLAGEFIVKNGLLVGKHAIVVPQTIKRNHLLIELKIKDNTYTFSFGNDRKLEGSTEETYKITIPKAVDPSIPGKITASISDWENKTEVELIENKGEGEDDGDNPNPIEPSTGYGFSLPDFSDSSVYDVMNGNIKVAEICREYLKNEDIDNQAIVIYPVREGVTDLTKGYVAQILDGHAGNPLSGSVHGGSVSWDNSSNTLTYQDGSLKAGSQFCIDEEGNITLNTIVDSSTLSLTPNIILDERDNNTYPVVKIATQYWMADNLKAIVLTNGTALTDATTGTKWKETQTATNIVNMLYSKDGTGVSILYNYASIISPDMPPVGWRIPEIQKDWIKLKNYLNESYSTLMDTSCEGGTNLTGFSAKNYGNRNKDGNYISLGYACFGIKEKYYYTISSDKMTSNTGGAYGNNIRCIKE